MILFFFFHEMASKCLSDYFAFKIPGSSCQAEPTTANFFFLVYYNLGCTATTAILYDIPKDIFKKTVISIS